MKTPAFWDQMPASWQARLLQPLGWVYGAVTAWRMGQAGASSPIPVICVGNLTAGGAGKTPTVQWLVDLLKANGLRPVILSRGHGGRDPGPVLVDPATHDAADVGDEPLLLSRDTPVVIARDRRSGIPLALEHQADCLVMDDGMQNPALVKDFTLAVIDGASGFGNGLCVPAGPLRAPASHQWPHIDHVLVLGAGEAGAQAESLAAAAGKPVSRGHLEPERRLAGLLKDKRVLAISGIGRPEKFRATLAGLGAEVVAEQRYPDHAAYVPEDAAMLSLYARKAGLLPVTTEKDAVKLAPLWREAEHGPLAVLPVTLALDQDAGLRQAILRVAGQR